jgi:5'-3' exonuclease
MLFLFDSSYIAYKNLYGIPHLEDRSDEDIKTGVLFGFLSDVLLLGERYQTNQFIFCFDSKVSKRKELYPEYKLRPKKDDQLVKIKAMKEQLADLKTNILPKLGFSNVFEFEGYEADDIIAQLCNQELDDIVIVSSDEDLFQCIHPNVKLYSMSHDKLMYDELFFRIHNIPTWKWGWVKAYAGCTSDNVKGIEGVGVKTAIKYLNNELNPNTKAYQSLTSSEGNAIFERNLKLVMLPFDTTLQIQVKDNAFTKKGFMDIVNEYQLYSFIQEEHLARWRDFFMGYRAGQANTKNRRRNT